MAERAKLLIAGRDAARAGIRLIVDGRLEICAEAETPERAIRAAMREQPDVCLVHGDFGGDDTVGIVRGICRAAPRAAVVVLALEGDVDDLLELIRAGAVGYVPGPLDAERLRRVIGAVSAGEAVVPRAMILDLLLELRMAGVGADGLTSRESQVYGMLRRGHSTGEIAERLHIAPVTVRRHISELVHKLGVEDRSALVGTAPPSGLRSRDRPVAVRALAAGDRSLA